MSKEVEKIEEKNQEIEQGEVVELKPVETATQKKPNIFKRAASKIGAGIRQVRESPVACAIGAGIGALATLGVQAYLSHRFMEDVGIGDPVEVEDLGEVTDETETEEIMNE